MNVGYAQAVITPSLGRSVFLAGFGRNRRAVAVHDDLTARALCLRENEKALLLIALDLIGLFRPDVLDIAEQIRAATDHACDILIACTHTHHGPDTLGLWGPTERESGVDPRYLATLKERIVAAGVAAYVNATRPVVAYRAAAVGVPGLARNARDADILDEELAILQLLDENERPAATICDFPCHPEVLWDGNPVITADYVHSLRVSLEAATGAPCLFFVGALGGMMTPDVVDHSFAEADTMGRRLAVAGLQALIDAPAQPFSGSHPAFSYSRRDVRLPLQNPLFEAAFAAGLLPDARDDAGQVTTHVSLIRIGGLWLAGVPGELFPKLGLALKAEMRAAAAAVAAVIGLADDELGYILPDEDYVAPTDWLSPGEQYEESMSIGPQTGSLVINGVRELF